MNMHGSNQADVDPSDLTVTEQQVGVLWNEVLRSAARVHPADNFFALGGDSMAMVTLEFRIKEDMNVELQPGTLIGAPTLRELSRIVDSLMPLQGDARSSV